MWTIFGFMFASQVVVKPILWSLCLLRLQGISWGWCTTHTETKGFSCLSASLRFMGESCMISSVRGSKLKGILHSHISWLQCVLSSCIQTLFTFIGSCAWERMVSSKCASLVCKSTEYRIQTRLWSLLREEVQQEVLEPLVQMKNPLAHMLYFSSQ